MYRSMLGVDSVYRTSSKRLNLMVPGNWLWVSIIRVCARYIEKALRYKNRLESILVIEGILCMVLIMSKEN
ncbi:hypothetical protein EYC80_004303 [Monilinia laxa]|uniref:Uncharacterized protein n=1 Tax=Monilinia laxa TaxID=61186 RepID=A0A5N6KMC4_MONLA|nr:hypothetical protein EYC80_004303 [Monilinia laxa]